MSGGDAGRTVLLGPDADLLLEVFAEGRLGREVQTV